MDLTAVVNISSGALVIRKAAGRYILFVQKPGMTKAQVVAAAIKPEDIQNIVDFIQNPPVGEWNRMDVTVVTAADLTGL